MSSIADSSLTLLGFYSHFLVIHSQMNIAVEECRRRTLFKIYTLLLWIKYTYIFKLKKTFEIRGIYLNLYYH